MVLEATHYMDRNGLNPNALTLYGLERESPGSRSLIQIAQRAQLFDLFW